MKEKVGNILQNSLDIYERVSEALGLPPNKVHAVVKGILESLNPPHSKSYPSDAFLALMEYFDWDVEKMHQLLNVSFPEEYIPEQIQKSNEALGQYYPTLRKAISGTVLEHVYYPEDGIPHQSEQINQHVNPRFRTGIGMATDEKGDILSNSRIQAHLYSFLETIGLNEKDIKPVVNILCKYCDPLGAFWYREIARERYLLDIEGDEREAHRQNVDRALRIAPMPTYGGTDAIEVMFDATVGTAVPVLVPVPRWGNVDLKVWNHGGRLMECPYLDENGKIHPEMLRKYLKKLKKEGHKRCVVYFNFPNNYSGVMPTHREALALARVVQEEASDDFFITSVCDEPYDPLTQGGDCIDRPFSSYLLPGKNKNMLTFASRNGTKREGLYGFRHSDLYVFTPETIDDEGISALEMKLKGLGRAKRSFSNVFNQYLVASELVGDSRICLKKPQEWEDVRGLYQQELSRGRKEEKKRYIQYVQKCNERVAAAIEGNNALSRYLKPIRSSSDASGGFFISYSLSQFLQEKGVTAKDVHLSGLLHDCGVIAPRFDALRINTTALFPEDIEPFTENFLRSIEFALQCRSDGQSLDEMIQKKSGQSSSVRQAGENGTVYSSDIFSEIWDPVDVNSLFWKKVERTLYYYLQGIPVQRKRYQQVVSKEKWTDEEAQFHHKNRLFDETFHPTQLRSPRFCDAWFNILSKAETLYDDILKRGHCWTYAEWAHFAEDLTKKLRWIVGHDQVSRFSQSEILSKAGIDEHLAHDLESKFQIPKKNWSKEKLRHFLDSEIYPHVSGAFQDTYDSLDQRWDETREISKEGRQLLLYGMLDGMAYWADFDLGKTDARSARAPGRIFSDWAAFVRLDVMRGKDEGLLPRKYWDDLGNILYKAEQADKVIFELTHYLQKTNGSHQNNRTILERLMNLLKEDRKEYLQKLLSYRNLIEKNQEEAGSVPMCFFSKMVWSHPRIDPECTKAVKKYAHLELRGNGDFAIEATLEEKKQLERARIIRLQIRHMNELSFFTGCADGTFLSDPKGFHSIIGQVQLSQCRDGDVSAWEAFLGEPDGGDYEVCEQQIPPIVPLFETPETTEPTYVLSFLEQRFSDCKRNVTEMNRRCGELFIAGSDLSRLMGQFPAFVQAVKFTCAVEDFNRRHGTDVRVKLGCGEEPFRQGCDFNPSGGKPILRKRVIEQFVGNGSVSQAIKIGHEELKILQNDARFLKKKMKNPDKICRLHGGMNQLAEIFPAFGFYTLQSRDREIGGTEMAPQFRLDAIEEIRNIHDVYFETDANGERLHYKAPLLSDFEEGGALYFLERARLVGLQAYQAVIGDSDSDFCGKPGKLPNGNANALSAIGELLAKMVPKNRPRPPARDMSHSDSLDELFKLAQKPEIDARAISAVIALKLLFPPVLLEKGEIFEDADHRGDLERVLSWQPNIDQVLKQMLMFEAVKDETFRILRRYNMGHLADVISEKYNKISKYRPAMQREYLHRLNRDWKKRKEKDTSKGFFDRMQKVLSSNEDISKWSEEELSIFSRSCVPLVREIIDPDWGKFLAKGTIAYVEAYRQSAPSILRHVLSHCDRSQQFLEALEERTQAIESELRSDYIEIPRKDLKKMICYFLQEKPVSSENSVGTPFPFVSGTIRKLIAGLFSDGEAPQLFQGIDKKVVEKIGQSVKSDKKLQSVFFGLSSFECPADARKQFDELIAVTGFTGRVVG